MFSKFTIIIDSWLRRMMEKNHEYALYRGFMECFRLSGEMYSFLVRSDYEWADNFGGLYSLKKYHRELYDAYWNSSRIEVVIKCEKNSPGWYFWNMTFYDKQKKVLARVQIMIEIALPITRLNAISFE